MTEDTGSTGGGTAGISEQDVLALLVRRLREVMALQGDIAPDARFDEDLHADSLDLVEVIEGVERDLRALGMGITVPEDELLAVREVGEVARLIAARTREQERS